MGHCVLCAMPANATSGKWQVCNQHLEFLTQSNLSVEEFFQYDTTEMCITRVLNTVRRLSDAKINEHIATLVTGLGGLTPPGYHTQSWEGALAALRQATALHAKRWGQGPVSKRADEILVRFIATDPTLPQPNGPISVSQTLTTMKMKQFAQWGLAIHLYYIEAGHLELLYSL